MEGRQKYHHTTACKMLGQDYYFLGEDPPDPYPTNKNNDRYSTFTQRHFTAGDHSQFLEFLDRTPEELVGKEDVSPQVLINTFDYIFNKFKKGIYVRIRHHRVVVFLPFSKKNFQNEYFQNIRVNPDHYKNVVDMMQQIASWERRPFHPKKVNHDVSCWYGNNGLVRLEYPISETESGVNTLHDMFVELCQERVIPDCDFFLHKRDFPILRKDRTESYENFFPPGQPMVSHFYPTYLPILGMTSSVHHSDEPIPTWEDWCRVEFLTRKKLFPKDSVQYAALSDFDEILWENKKPVAVFRGSSTGLGTLPRNNPRLFFSYLSSRGFPNLDVGITKWNLRPRKTSFYHFLDSIRIPELGLPLVSPLTPLQQAHYKYILHLPGHSFAYRLSTELMMGSVILMYPCPYHLWYSCQLKPWVHFIPLSAPKDPQNLFLDMEKEVTEKIQWCKDNDDLCRQIAQNARQFYVQFLQRDSILDFLVQKLSKLPRVCFPKRTLQNDFENIRLRNCNPLSMLRGHGLQDFSMDVIQETHSSKVYKTRIQKDMLDSHHCLVPATDPKNAHVIGFKVMNSKQGKSMENRHHAFVGHHVINRLTQDIPNFIHTYGYMELTEQSQNLLVMEHIEGMTMDQWLQCSPEAKQLSLVMEIVFPILLASHVAQQKSGFMHFDLYPWNIMIPSQESRNCSTEYWFLPDTKLCFHSKKTPRIIDYGKSLVFFQGEPVHHMEPFSFQPLHDVCIFLFSVFHIMLQTHTLSSHDIRQVFDILHFLSVPLCNQKFQTMQGLRSFLLEKKKFGVSLLDHHNNKNFRLSVPEVLSFLLSKLKPSSITIIPISPRQNILPMDQFDLLSLHCKSRFVSSCSFFSSEQDRQVFREFLRVQKPISNWKFSDTSHVKIRSLHTHLMNGKHSQTPLSYPSITSSLSDTQRQKSHKQYKLSLTRYLFFFYSSPEEFPVQDMMSFFYRPLFI